MIIFIKNITIEGPETLGDFFYKEGFKDKTVDLSRGERLPSDLSQVDAVVCLGGPMNVYEEDKYAFLKEEDIFIKRILSEEIPFLGICLGAQEQKDIMLKDYKIKKEIFNNNANKVYNNFLQILRGEEEKC